MGVYRNIAILMLETHCFPPLDFRVPYSWQTHFGPTSEGEFIGETIEHSFDVATVAVGSLRCILEP